MIAPDARTDDSPAPDEPTTVAETPPAPGLARQAAWVLGGIALAAAFGFAAAAMPEEALRNEGRWYVRWRLALFLLETFRFHMAVGLLLLSAIAWWRGARRVLWIVLPVVLYAGWPTARNVLPKATPPEVPNAARLTVFNANLLYWNRAPQFLRDEILAHDAEVVTLQEYHHSSHSALFPALRERYPHHVTVPQSDAFGVAVFSKRPLREVRTDLELGLACPQIRAVIDLDGRPVAVYSIHLMPPFGSRRATQQRVGLAALIEVLEDEPYPAIVCGDFNMIDDCSLARPLHRAGLLDTHTAIGFGRQATWQNQGKVAWAPGVRIDHIYVTEKDFACLRSGTGRGRGSDHCPIYAEVGLLPR